MSGTAALKRPGLARLAAEIRYRHDDGVCTCVCTCGHSSGGPGMAETMDTLLAPPPMDARERKWAAAKLLRPVAPDESEDELTPDEQLEVCRLLLVMYLDGAPLTPKLTPERARLRAEQFRETVRFARRAWGIHVGDP